MPTFGFRRDRRQRIAEQLDREWELIRYKGADFNNIFAGLNAGTYDCIASGTTITPDREQIVDFCPPYVVSGQSLGASRRSQRDMARLRFVVSKFESLSRTSFSARLLGYYHANGANERRRLNERATRLR
jgi:ABC-type amino acid transport substrate-binding protein